MKFDQAIKEGYTNYLPEDEEKISVSKTFLDHVNELVSDEELQKFVAGRVIEDADKGKTHKLDSALDYVFFNIGKYFKKQEDNEHAMSDEDYESMFSNNDKDKKEESNKSRLDNVFRDHASRNPKVAQAVQKRDQVIQRKLADYEKETNDLMMNR